MRVYPSVFALAVLVAFPPLTFAEDKPAEPKVGEEVSSVPGISIVRQPFSFFGSASLSSTSGAERADFRLSGKNVGLDEVVSHVAPVERTRYFATVKLPRGKYNVNIAADHQDTAFANMAKVCDAAFGVNLVREKRLLPVLVLKDAKTDDAKPLTKVGEDEFGGRYDGKNVLFVGSMPEFAEQLEGYVGKIVVNDSKLDGRYRIEMPLRSRTAHEDAQKWLNEHGLELLEDQREVEAVFLEAKELP